LAARRYNPFNLLCSNTTEGWVGTWQGNFHPLTPGIHVVTNRGDLDNAADPRIRRAFDAAPCLGLEKAPLQTILTDLGRLCADTTGPEPICRVGGERGTVSSSLIALQADGTIAVYWHANGPPTERPYMAVAIPSLLEGEG
jgi:hypothetical protein